jgi:hypothetical protein
VSATRQALALSSFLLLAGCGAPDSPEAQVRAVVAEAEQAAEARDASRLADLVDPGYRDPQGNGAQEIQRYLRGWLIARQDLRLLTRIDAMEFPAENLARLSVTVGMLGREAGGEAWDLAADVYEIDLTLARDGDEWRVTRAEWRRGAG